MSAQTGDSNLFVGKLMIEELFRCGVDYFCLSPGARCTPLTVAAARHPTARRRVFNDERAAAYHALGYARATGRAAALICTSGTAAANYLPAVVEASMDMLPMMMLTTDRPPELRDCGANQVIHQPGLYERYVRWQFDLPCPDDNIPPEFVLTTVDQAVHRAHSGPAGPVHLNCMFREPLVPDNGGDDNRPDNPELARWRSRRQPFTLYEPRQSMLTDDHLDQVSAIMNSAASGLLVVGRLAKDSERTAVARLAQHLGWPVLPDILSGLRLGADTDNVIPYCDLLLQSVKPWTIDRPAVVLHLGGRVVSKRLVTFLKAASFDEYIHVADHPFRHDWQHMVTHRMEGSPAQFCDAVAPLVSPAGESRLLKQLRSASERFRAVVQRTMEVGDTLSDAGIARAVAADTPASHGLFVANSLPIRILDSFADFKPQSATRTPLAACNRGASGIDGTIAAASGYAVGLARPVTLIIGDLAFLHDLNSLSIVRSIAHPLTIVLINNDGGGLFSLLPIADCRDVFEKYFATPHGLKFAASAEQFGIDYHAPKTSEEFATCYRQAVLAEHPTLIEVATHRETTRDLYHNLLTAARQIVADP